MAEELKTRGDGVKVATDRIHLSIRQEDDQLQALIGGIWILRRTSRNIAVVEEAYNEFMASRPAWGP